MDEVDSIVVGAGVIGLAIARELARAGQAPMILEAEDRFGTGVSARNSEVIHAGLYYPTGSLKARLCVEGRERLYAYCRERDVPHRRTGKLIFAHDLGQRDALDAIARSGEAAGVMDLRRLSRAEAHAVEPALDCAEALLSPSSGIVDASALMTALLAEAESAGALLACRSRVARISRRGSLWCVHLDDGPIVAAPRLVNAAGLGAQALARAIEGLPAADIPTLHLARGHYFAYSGRVPFQHLIYPVPEPGGLGTHLTLDLAGRARFGPDVEWIDAIDFSVDASRHGRFVAAARRIWPDLDPARLEPAYAGIRPKISARGEAAADFSIQGPQSHGLAGLVNLYGIESPGLTSALALAPEVLRRLES